MDLCSSSYVLLTPDDRVLTISTGIQGPPPPGTFFLILGRASSTLRGLIIYPSLVDEDYTGELKILASAPYGPVSISTGSRLAQALPLPLSPTFPSLGPSHGPSEPGSSDIFWVQELSSHRPTLKLKINGKSFEGILDSGTDSTVISQRAWPTAWPLQPSMTHLQGIGQSSNTLQSSQVLNWIDPEGNTGTVQPYVVPGLPVNLWGRDILSQMRIYMCSAPNDTVAQQMLSQGYIPGAGLGKFNQGRTDPVQPLIKMDRAGLGYPHQQHFL